MNSTDQGPSLEDNNCTASQEFPGVLWNPKIHYYVNNGPSLVLILSQINSILNLLFLFL
jgi:hypothetical protein